MERPTFLLGKEQTVADGEIVKLLLKYFLFPVYKVSLGLGVGRRLRMV